MQPASRQALPRRDVEREGNKRTSATSSCGVWCFFFAACSTFGHLRLNTLARQLFDFAGWGFFFLFRFFWGRDSSFSPLSADVKTKTTKNKTRPISTGMMWTSHDTVGFVFLAGFCVQFGFSFEGKNGRFSSVPSWRACCPAWWEPLGRRKC